MRLPCLWALCLLCPVAWAGPPRFAGAYGHTATAAPEDVVWTVEEDGAQWRVTRTTDGEATRAQPLSARGRAAFWSRMGWPDDTATEAACLSWGERPGSLADLLADTPPAPPAPGDDAGYAVLCHVPTEARARIGWLAGHATDWFYYDPMAGVMEARRLR